MPNMTWSNMFNKAVGLLTLLGLLLIPSADLGAEGKVDGGEHAGDRKLLVVYSTNDGEIDEAVRMLDIALGHFSPEIVWKNDEDLSKADLRGITHLIYFGETKKELPRESIVIMSGFSGPMLAIGENIEQFPERFPFDAQPQEGLISKVSKPGASSEQILDFDYPVAEVVWNDAKTILLGWRGEYSFPVMAMKDDSAFFSILKLDYASLYLLSEGLHSFFHEQHAAEHLAYIRLEDVHPFSDIPLLKETGGYLAERKIPFMIALIPVYTNPQTGEQIHLRDVPELVSVLKDLQQRGASIVLHGYTHQYRSTETGEGFEFWDVENNIPISGHPDEEIHIKHRHEFASAEEYEAYREELRQFDHTYTKTRIESGIRELTSLGLYPVAFEPPHYTMSQEGYRTVAEYFPFLVGQVQVSDKNWHVLISAPSVSRPSFLNGMTLLPETIGFYDPSSLTPLEDVKEKIKEVQFVHDGMIGMFYHPYLGLEHLKEMVALVDTVPNLKWIDLKNWGYAEREKFTAVSCLDKPCDEVMVGKKGGGISEIVLWSIAGIVSVVITAFVLYTVRIRMGLRKQLFEERVSGGQ